MLPSYSYEATIDWTGRRGGMLAAPGLPQLEVSAPPEFSGESGKWTPEHLLVGAAASCLMATFVAIAEISHVQLHSFRMKVAAKLEKVPGEGYRFTEVRLMPEIGVAEGEQERAEKALAKAEKSCFVTQSLRATVVVEPKLFVATAEVAC
jgi:peroxiredoxin-like protein